MRSRRTGTKTKEQMDDRMKAVTAVAKQLQQTEGMPYFKSFERAEQIVPL